MTQLEKPGARFEALVKDELTVGQDGRVVQPESKTREYKQDLSSPEKVMRAVVTFVDQPSGTSGTRKRFTGRCRSRWTRRFASS